MSRFSPSGNHSVLDQRSLDAIKKKVQAIAKNHPKRAGKGLRVVAERIMTVSKKEWAPVKTGAMRNDGRVLQPSDLRVELTYSKDYAWDQHENRFYKHKIGRAKFLEQPMMLALPTLLVDIAIYCPLDSGVL